ncbi:MAG: alpha/beta fold hydrolase [Alphaproteobacteria bacterium]|nr:alpha/beta fold hydrolase [Alphaproteobacteria bacterium]
MTGIKATMLEAFCQARNQQFTRFDYQGHGTSSGAFDEGTIGLWRDDALTVFEGVTEGPQIVVGSSMGAWIALLLAQQRRSRIAGLLLLAPAADFTTELLWKNLTPDAREQIKRDGVWMRPSIYDDGPYPITRNLIEESRAHLVLGNPIPFDGPVRILLGLQDDVIPVDHILRTTDALTSDDVEITLIKNGDHRLSTPDDLDKIRAAVDALSKSA